MRGKRVAGHSYDNVTNPRCESGARGGSVDVRGVPRLEGRASDVMMFPMEPRTGACVVGWVHLGVA